MSFLFNTCCWWERTFVCIEEAPSLWPPGTVCQRGTWGWAQSNASSWHCAYDTSNNLNYVQQTVMHVFDLFSFCMRSCLIYVHIRVPERRVLPLLWCNASCCLSVVFRFNCTHNKLFFLFGVWIFSLIVRSWFLQHWIFTSWDEEACDGWRPIFLQLLFPLEVHSAIYSNMLTCGYHNSYWIKTCYFT